jgi:hypothetical protein
MKGRKTTLAGALISLLFLAACGSSGGLGDILGGGGGSNQVSDEIRGTVDYVDTANRSIVMTNVSGYQSMLSNSGGNTVRVYYETNTPVEYQGQTYRAADLERGDEIAVRVDESGNNLVARSVTVLRDISTGSSSSGSFGTNIRGTVRYVDTGRRTIEINRDGYTNSVVTVEYDPNTYVTFSGRTHAVADLERGDEIDIRVRDLGSGRWLAQDINVVRSVSGSGSIGGSSSNAATIRGTVRFVDMQRRTLELESTSWISGFSTGAGSSAGTRVIQFGSNAGVEVNGVLNNIQGLERGDVVDVYVSNTSSSTLFADRIVLVRDVNSFR